MIRIYGSMLCPDCVQCRQELDEADIAYEYLDLSEKLTNLKEFLAIRDSDRQFDAVRENGGIGIPCIVKEDGCVTLDWNGFLM